MPLSNGVVQPQCNVHFGNYRLRRQTELHHARMRKAKSGLDRTAPATTKLKHFKQKVNTVQMMNDRYEAIRKENMRLFHKMVDIKKHGTVRTGGQLPLTVTNSTEAKYSRSQHYPARKARHRQIDKANARMHERLRAASTQLPTTDTLARQFRVNRKYGAIARREKKKKATKTRSTGGSAVLRDDWDDRFGDASTARTRRENGEGRVPAGAVFHPELQRRLNPECIPASQRRPSTAGSPTGAGDSGGGGVGKRSSLRLVKQGPLPPEPLGLEQRPRRPRRRKEKLRKPKAWPEERPPATFDHPGLSRMNDML